MKMTATILDFHQAECDRAVTDSAGSTAELAKGQSAEIIIFPGVRIERQANNEIGLATAKPMKRAKRAARRKS